MRALAALAMRLIRAFHGGVDSSHGFGRQAKCAPDGERLVHGAPRTKRARSRRLASAEPRGTCVCECATRRACLARRYGCDRQNRTLLFRILLAACASLIVSALSFDVGELFRGGISAGMFARSQELHFSSCQFVSAPARRARSRRRSARDLATRSTGTDESCSPQLWRSCGQVFIQRGQSNGRSGDHGRSAGRGRSRR